MLGKALLSASVSAAPKVYVEEVFQSWLYTGNGSTQTITNGIDLSGKGGLVWIKSRSGSAAPDTYETHSLYDTERGVKKILRTNETGGQVTSGAGNYEIYAFGSSGFSVGANNNYNLNSVGALYASWTFRKAPKFFDVVTYTGTGSNTTIAHNLGAVPGSIIVKRTDTTADWAVYHRSLANTQYLVLNTTAAAATGATWWNSTTPTSSVFSVGTDASVNASGGTYVAYLFAHDAGGFGTAGTDNVVSCGGFTADGSGNATVSLGYEPQWILVKRTSSATDWHIYDTMRGWTVNSSGVGQQVLYPNLSSVEGAGYPYSVNATGFGLTGVGAGNTFIYIAIRRGPMKTPTVGTEVFYQLARTGTAADTTITGAGFPPDAHLNSVRNVTNNGFNALFFDKLRGANNFLIPLSTDAESSSINSLNSFNQDGVTYGAGSNINSNTKNYINWFFRRAPGFFDVVAYTGTGSATTVSHNLGVIPELIIVKCRSAVVNWTVYSASLPISDHMTLNASSNADTNSNRWNNTPPTATVFSLSSSSAVNGSGFTYIAYLFASCPGVSKVGSYTGTGTTKQIDCGFTAGARFVLIKRTDSTGDWYVWDTARGIISGNDPFLLINSTAAENTSTDYIDPLSSGFEISSTAPAAINANGGTYIFLAIA